MRYPPRRGGVQGGGHDSCINCGLRTTSQHVMHSQMRPFSSKKDIQRLAAVLQKHGDSISALRTAQIELSSKFRNLELEWVNAHEKLKSISGRIAKRQAIMAAEQPELPAQPGNGETEPDPYAGMDPISASIKRRRDLGRTR